MAMIGYQQKEKKERREFFSFSVSLSLRSVVRGEREDLNQYFSLHQYGNERQSLSSIILITRTHY
jgi:hypothetical protein